MICSSVVTLIIGGSIVLNVIGKPENGNTVLNRVEKVLQNLRDQKTRPESSGSVHFDEHQFTDHANQFKDFVRDFDKYYESDAEVESRFDIFRTNLKEIDRHNYHELGTAVYGVTEFTDLTDSEFRQYTGLAPIDRSQLKNIPFEKPTFDLDTKNQYGNQFGANITFDYKRLGKVLDKVQNQKQCGSCWAHAVAATLESAYAIKHGELIELSKQQLVDCDSNSDGCCGGYPDLAFSYIQKSGGLMTERDYKQRVGEGACEFDAAKVRAKVEKYYVMDEDDYPEDNEWLYEQYINTYGPLVAVLNANGFRYYKSGIMNQPDFLCRQYPWYTNHALLNVGYGFEIVNGERFPYWLIKNSWGKNWGEEGYIRIERGRNICGIGWWSAGVVAA